MNGAASTAAPFNLLATVKLMLPDAGGAPEPVTDAGSARFPVLTERSVNDSGLRGIIERFDLTGVTLERLDGIL